MTEPLPNFRVVPEYHMEKLFLRKDMSRALLGGNVIFIEGENKTFGSLYTLAKNHNMKAHTRRGKLDGKKGTFIQFKDAQDTERIEE